METNQHIEKPVTAGLVGSGARLGAGGSRFADPAAVLREAESFCEDADAVDEEDRIHEEQMCLALWDELRNLRRQNELFRNETRICADCDGVRKAEYDAVMASLKTVRELCTTDHESKDEFIRRVLLCLPNTQAEPQVGSPNLNK